MTATDPFEIWLTALQQRHLADLTMPEVRRALQALSYLYVEDRSRIPRGGAFDSRGKRIAFALFYAPLHFLQVRCVIRALGAADPAPHQILDLGCGTGAAGAAWALETAGRSLVVGVDRHPWAIQETRWTYATLNLRGRTRRARLDQIPFGAGDSVIAAFTVNELGPPVRSNMLGRLMAAARRGGTLLIVEPISRRVVPWWEEWAQALRPLQARVDEWRFEQPLPEPLQRLDTAAGLDHSVLTCRSLWVAPAALAAWRGTGSEIAHRRSQIEKIRTATVRERTSRSQIADPTPHDLARRHVAGRASRRRNRVRLRRK